MTSEELLNRKKKLEAELSEVNAELTKLRLNEFKKKCPFVVGQRLFYGQDEIEITNFGTRYGVPRLLGRKVLRNGGLHKVERHYYYLELRVIK